MRRYLESFVALEMLILAGTPALEMHFGGVFIVLYVITAFLLFLSRAKHNSFKRNLPLLLIFAGWTFLNTAFRHPQGILYIIIILYMSGTCFVVSSVDFYSFRLLLLKWLNIILGLSLVAQIGYMFSVLPITTYTDGNNTWELCFGLFNVGANQLLMGEKISRFSSIYWEPGQMQIVVLYIMCLFGDVLCDIPRNFKAVKFFLLPLISLLLSISTTGYICLAILVFCVIYYQAPSSQKSIKTPIYKKFFYLLLGVASLIGILFSPAVTEKFDDSSNGSFIIRASDTSALLRISIENPLTGVGYQTEKLTRLSNFYGSITAANGWLNLSAENGIPFLFMLLICMYKGVKKMKPQIPPILIFLVLFLSQCGEHAVYYPYTYLFVFTYRSYIKESISNNRDVLPNKLDKNIQKS